MSAALASQSVAEEMFAWLRTPAYYTTRTPDITQYVRDRLLEFGLPNTKINGPDRSGALLATLHGERDGPTRLFCTDATDVGWRASQTYGPAHLYGPQVPLAALVGAAQTLVERRRDLRGTLRLLFMPGHRHEFDRPLRGFTPGSFLPEPQRRPRVMPAADHRDVARAFAFNGVSLPSLRPGQFGIGAGPFFAGGGCIAATITGRSGHTGAPNDALDPTLPVLHGALRLSAFERAARGSWASVIVNGIDDGLSRENVISGRCEYGAWYRAHDPSVLAAIPRKVTEAFEDAARETGLDGYRVAVRTHSEFPAVENDALLVRGIAALARDVLGPEGAIDHPPIRRGHARLGFLSRVVPTCVGVVGLGEGKAANSKALAACETMWTHLALGDVP